MTAPNSHPRPGDPTAYGEQVASIKAEHPDCLVLFRLGDFYEAYEDDAWILARELDMIVCGREMKRQSKERTPMVGLSLAAVEVYVARLVHKGYKVAVAEAQGNPSSERVERKVIRIIVPDEPIVRAS